MCYCRAIEDIGVVYLGSAVFKISRLTCIALFSVHLFACIFYRVKIVGANDPEDVIQFYKARNVQEDVSDCFAESIQSLKPIPGKVVIWC